MKSSTPIGVPSLQTASFLIRYTTVCGLLLVTSIDSATWSFTTAVLSGRIVTGEGCTASRTSTMSATLPLALLVFQLTSFFSSATVRLPPSLVGPVLQSLGFWSHSASDTENCFVVPEPVHPLSRSAAAVPMATRPPSPFEPVRMFPPVRRPQQRALRSTD
jgi:hypothetical protein